ncbi:MAG: hypothetical protein U9Q03_04000 [Patescibacteria group bacterium]|nr:hypothetical protein [Patescibacteria group bacterium]
MDIVGKVLISWTVLRVHYKLMKEHGVDAVVDKEIRTEEMLGVLAIFLMVGAYVLKMSLSVGYL